MNLNRSVLPSTLVLVRHGHVEGISPERFRGRSDLPLTTLGVKQAQATAQFISSEWGVDAVYSSPLRRCIDTAKTIADQQNLKVKSLDELIDIDYGQWQGETVEHVESLNADLYEKWIKHPHYTVIPDGETLAEVQSRLVRAFDQMCRNNHNDTIIAVGHDSTIRVFLTLLLSMPLSAYWQIKQDPCAINVLTFLDDVCKLDCINSTAHLNDVANTTHILHR